MLSPNTACAAPIASTYIQYWLTDSPTIAPTTTTVSRASSEGALARLRPDITAPPPDHDEDDDHERDRLRVPAKCGWQHDRLQHADGDPAERGDDHVLEQAEQGGSQREQG